MIMRKDPKTGRKVAVGALIAGVGGYLAGLLTAPKSGEETREDLANKAVDIKEDTAHQLQVAGDELAVVVKEAQSKTQALGAQARGEFNEAMIRAKDAEAKLKTVVKALKAGQAEDPELNKAIKQAKQAKKNLSKFLRG